MAPKRGSSPKKTARGSSPKRAKKAKSVEAPLLDFVGKCDEIPKPCREMLQAAVPICLEVVEADRHKFQVEVLERFGALLGTVESKKRDAISVVEAELKEIEGHRAEAFANEEAKKATADSKNSECEEKEKVVDSAREGRDAAAKVLADAQSAQKAFDEKKAHLADEEESFAKLLAEGFQPLKEGTLPGNWQTRNKKIGELKKKLLELGAQESLGDALVSTLKMTPEKREGSFAKVTMEFTEDIFTKHTAKVKQDIAGLDAEAAGHSAAIASAEAALSEKKEALQVVEKEWDAMQDIWTGLSKEASQATKELKQIEMKIPRVTKNIEKAQADLTKFLELPALFSTLKEKSTAAPEEPEETEEKKDVEEDAAEGDKPDEEMQEAS
jgi:hypothetical protein